MSLVTPRSDFKAVFPVDDGWTDAVEEARLKKVSFLGGSWSSCQNPHGLGTGFVVGLLRWLGLALQVQVPNLVP